MPATTSKRSRAPASAKSASAPRPPSPPDCCRARSLPSSARIRASAFTSWKASIPICCRRSAPAISISPSAWCPAGPATTALSFISLVKDRLVPAVRADHPLLSERKLQLADLTRSRLDHLSPQPYRARRVRADLHRQPAGAAQKHDRMHLVRLRAGAGRKRRLHHAGALADFRRQPQRAVDRARCCSIRPCSPGRWRSISRAKHELSAVCLAFLAELAAHRGQDRSGP